MDCKFCESLPRPCPADDRVTPLLNILNGEGGDNFNAVPHGHEFLAICVGEDNPHFQDLIAHRLFHEMEIFKGDLVTHFHAVAHFLKSIIGEADKIIPKRMSPEQNMALMTFEGKMPSYREVESIVKSITRLPKIAKNFKTLISSDMSSEELSKHVRESVDYWNCPCADVATANGQITITHICCEKGDVPLKEAGYTADNIRALSEEVDRAMEQLSKALHDCAHSLEKDVKVESRKNGATDGKDAHSLAFAYFAYDVLAQMIECCSKCINDIFHDLSEYAHGV